MRRALLFALLAVLVLAGTRGAAESDKYDVYAIRYATLAGSPERAMAVWLLKGLDGRIALIDSGFHREQYLRQPGLKEYIRPSDALLPLGIQAGGVTDLLITDMHWDHAGGLDLFPNAHVWIQKDQYEYYTGQAWQLASGHAGVDPGDVQELVRLNTLGRVTLLGGNVDFMLSGITFAASGQGASATQFIVAQARNSLVVLAADNLPFYEGLKAHGAATEGAAAHVGIVERMSVAASEPRLVIPGHDSAVFTRFKKISDRIVQIE